MAAAPPRALSASRSARGSSIRGRRTTFCVRAVAELEGHPDNALAAWYGGAVIAAFGDDGLTAATFAPPAAGAVVVVPEIVLSTAQARTLMPATYAREDVVHNVQRAALLGAALAGGRIDLLRAAVRDKLHQPYRASVIPGLAEILELDDPALVAVALSGAGPSVLALVHDEPQRIGALVAAVFARHRRAQHDPHAAACFHGSHRHGDRAVIDLGRSDQARGGPSGHENVDRQ